MIKSVRIVFLFVLSLALAACKVEPKPIKFGHDNCAYCKMGISDPRFGAELLTKKGRNYKFDDLHCLKGFLDDKIIPEDQVHSLWVIDFSQPEELIDAKVSLFIQNGELKSPMGSNIAAFKNKSDLDEYYSKNGGQTLTWRAFIDSK